MLRIIARRATAAGDNSRIAPRDMSAVPRRWDVFCRVVDNFGDAGVSWRLARQLAAEHGADVTLWLDELAALARIAPGVDPHRARQRASGVNVRRWSEPFPDTAPPDVVVEAFGCGLPEAYVAALAAAERPPTWFVLEYLSAEPWVGATHGLASPHPRLGLRRQFWFPGFIPETGGLLRERGLFAARDAFWADPAARARLWASLGVAQPQPAAIRISLFCYPNPALPDLLDAWADGDVPILCVVPDGVATGALDAWSGGRVPHAGGPGLDRGRLRLHAVPFVSQDDYDRVLWACDVNFVRGEDSAVRGQWAARPFAWHVYPQADAVHLGKLRAFLDRYSADLAPQPARAVRRFMQAWNGDPDAAGIAPAWLDFLAARPHLDKHASGWAAHLATVPDLASGMVKAAVRKL
jgi:uncharacterized repeat protein (TIGR03837 family)